MRRFLLFLMLFAAAVVAYPQTHQRVGEPADTLMIGHAQIDSSFLYSGKVAAEFSSIRIDKVDTIATDPSWNDGHESLKIRHLVRPHSNDRGAWHYAVDLLTENDSTNSRADSVGVMTALNANAVNNKGFVEGIETATFGASNNDSLGGAKVAWAAGTNYGFVSGLFYGMQASVDNFAGAYTWGNPYGNMLGTTVGGRFRIKNQGYSHDGLHFGDTANINTSYSILATTENASYLGGPATLATPIGVYYNLSNTGAGASISTHKGIYIGLNNSGSIDTNYDLYIAPPVNTGTIGSHYGIYMPDQTVSGATTNYAFYSGGGKSYHLGNVGLGFVPVDSTKLFIRPDANDYPIQVQSNSGENLFGVTNDGGVYFGEPNYVDENWAETGKHSISDMWSGTDGYDSYTRYLLKVQREIVDKSDSNYVGGMSLGLVARDTTQMIIGLESYVENHGKTESIYGIYTSASNDANANAAYGIFGSTTLPAGGSTDLLAGMCYSNFVGGSATDVFGVKIDDAAYTAAGENASLTRHYGVYVGMGTGGAGTATVTNNYGLYVKKPTVSANRLITNNYGLYLEDQGISYATKKYAIYSDGGDSYHKDNIGVGVLPASRYKLNIGGDVNVADTLYAKYLTVNNAYTLPAAKGAAGQFLSYDGTWAAVAGGAGDITSVTAGDGLKGGGIANDVTLDVNLSANGGLQVSSDSVGIKLDGTTLTKSTLGLKVAPNTFAAYSHTHTGTYEPVFSVLGISKGGTNATSYTASQLLRMNSAGTAFESAGVTVASFALAAAGVTNGDSHDHSGGDGAQIAYSSLSGLPTLGTIASQASNNVSITGGNISGTGLTLVQGASVAPTLEGVVQWDTDDDKLKIGSGSATKTFSDDAYNASTYAAGSHVHTGTYEPANSNIQSHISSTSNPHSVTATQVLPSQTGNSGKVLGTNGTVASWVTASSGTGDIEAVNVTAPITGGGSSGSVTVGADTSSSNTALATKGWVQRQGYGIGGGDITSVVAGDGLKGGGIASDVTLDLNVSANGGLQVSSDSAGIKLDGSTLSKSSLGLRVTTNTFAAYSHNHAASEVTSGTLVHERGGLEADVSAYSGLVKISGGSTSAVTDNSANWNTAYTDRMKWDGGATGLDAPTGRTSLGLGGAATLNVGTSSGTVAAGDHAHSGVYEPVFTTLGISKGGTNATSYTSSQLLRMNAAGTAFESAGVTTASFATSGHDHASTYAPIGSKFITQTADATLTGEQALSSLATGIVKNTTGTGVLSIAIAGTDYLAPALTSAYLFVGNASNVAAGVAVTGDVTITNAGLVTLAANAADSTNLADGSVTSETIKDGQVKAVDLAALSSADLAGKLTDETGSGGGFVRATSPAITGANLGVATASTISGKIEHLRFTIISPNAAVTSVGSPYNIPIWASVDSAITITRINVTCNADPTTEIAGDLKYADTFIGLANATVINDFDTSAGVRDDNSITSASVAAGKCLYVLFDAVPESALKTIAFDILYYYQ